MAAIIISVVNKTYSQVDDDLVSFSYMLAPIGNDEIEFNKTNLAINIPVTINNGVLTNNVGLDFYQVQYNADNNFSTEDLEKFYDLHYGLSYTFPISNTWFLNGEFKTSLVSNLSDQLDFNDLFFSGEVSTIRKINLNGKPASLKLGVMYSAITGKPKVLPAVSFTKQVSEKFTYSIGFPKTYTEYKINERSSFNSFFQLDGFYANLSNSILVNDLKEARKASFSSTFLGIEYSHRMDNLWDIFFKTGYSINNDFSLRDSNNNEFFDFDLKSRPFFSTGIKYNF